MNRKIIVSIVMAFASVFTVPAQPRPTPAQSDWQEQEFYLFMHFGPNTFTGKEWGHGDEAEEIFNPAALDCEQWCRIARNAGAKGIIITAKHHDGFCLWPSKFSTHTVRESRWRNGRGDVLKELSTACRKYNLKFGVYISPWDRNHPQYGTEKYNEVFTGMMEEIFSQYGPVWELWWDGANGEGPNGKRQQYDWHRFKQTVKKLSPNTVVFSDVGPHIRWVGNESGIAGTTNWNMLDTAGFTPGAGAPVTDTLNRGNRYGQAWIPAECDVSIRPGWFYHENENDKVKTPQQLFNLYLQSVGRGANLLLNVPPDTRGLIRPEDSAALMGFRQLREAAFGRNLLPAKWQHKPPLFNGPNNHLPLGGTVELPLKKTIYANCIVLQEDLTSGQSIAGLRIELLNGTETVQTLMATTIGRKRILVFPATNFNHLRITLTDANNEKARMRGIRAFKVSGTFKVSDN